MTIRSVVSTSLFLLVIPFASTRAVPAHADPPAPNAAQKKPPLYDESTSGAKQIEASLKVAKRDGRNVLLQFGANWCGWCHKLHGLMASDKEIAATLKRSYVVALVDVNNNHNADIVARYGNPTRFGLPVIVVLDKNGKQLTTQDTGKLEEGDHHDPARVMAFLRRWAPGEEGGPGTPTTASTTPQTTPAAAQASPEGTGRIAGRIRDGAGRPVAGLGVTPVLRPPADEEGGRPRFLHICYTGADGRFATESTLPPGRYLLIVASRDHRYAGFASADLFLAPRADEVTTELTISPGVLVTGRVIDLATGKPLAGVRVEGGADTKEAKALFPLEVSSDMAVTREDGHYSLRLPVGPAYLNLLTPDWAPNLRDTRRVSIRGSEGVGVTHDFTVRRAPTLTFVDAAGQPVAGVKVILSERSKPTDAAAPPLYQTQDRIDVPGKIYLQRFLLDHPAGGVFRAEAKGFLRAEGTFRFDADTGVLVVDSSAGTGSAVDAQGVVAMKPSPRESATAPAPTARSQE